MAVTRLKQIRTHCYKLMAEHRDASCETIAGWQCTIIAIDHLIRHGFHGGTLEKKLTRSVERN